LYVKVSRRATTLRNAENEFQNTGNCFFDPNIFEEEFAAADTTDRIKI
jgi:hypothetical protein